MSVREHVRERLEDEEKFVSHAYQDSKGFWTLGYGRLVDKRRGGGITKSEGAYLLENDIERREQEVATALPWSSRLDAARRGALVMMAFQMGTGGLLGFPNMLAAMKAGDWQAAHDHALDSEWAREDSPERAKRVATQILTGQWYQR